MSAFLLGTGFRADMGTCIRKLVLLKLIDACEDDGSRIFPAIATVAKAAQCSSRQVQRELRAFVDIGLLMLVREGGKGRRSTNEYALDLDVLAAISRQGWDAYAERQAKGDTVSPLEEGAKGDTGDVDRVTGETPKGDNGCHTTPPDPSLDPSGEREAGARAGRDDDGEAVDDPKAAERQFWRIVKDWPNFAGMPKEPAKVPFLRLSPAERDAAEARLGAWLALLKAQKKSHIPAPSTYFGQKLWTEVPDEPETVRPDVEQAAPFGKLWGALRTAKLLSGPIDRLPPPSFFIRRQIEQGGPEGERERLAHQARHGWPVVNAMHAQAAERRGFTVPDRLKPLADRFGQVKVGGDLWAAWERLHRRRGWPWIGDVGTPEWVYMPTCDAATGDLDAWVERALDEFEEALREIDDDGAARRAG